MIKCCIFCIAPKRHLGCHSTCPEYLEEKKKLDKVRADRYREYRTRTLVDDFRFGARNRNKKNHNYK